MVRGINKQGFFYVAGKQYKIRSAWLVPGAYGSRPLSGRIEKVENPFRALRSAPAYIEVAIDVGFEERTLVEWAVQGGKTYETVRDFMVRRTHRARRASRSHNIATTILSRAAGCVEPVLSDRCRCRTIGNRAGADYRNSILYIW